MTYHQSGYNLTEEQIEHFDRHGYLKLEKILTDEQLEQLRQYADNVEQLAMEKLKRNAQEKDFVFSMTFFVTYLNRVLHFHFHAGFESLYLLGHPKILGAAESLCGKDFLPTIDMMVLKHQDNNAVIPWHQDLIYPADQYRVVTVGIYLDDSNIDNGALTVLPNSGDKKKDICAIVENPPASTIEVPAKAGDVLLHNPMMVHCSSAMKSGGKRRTLYYEFRPMAQALTEQTWPQRLLDRRLNLMYTALDLYSKQYPQDEHFQWQIDQRWSNHTSHQSLAPLYLEPIPFNTANFCRK